MSRATQALNALAKAEDALRDLTKMFGVVAHQQGGFTFTEEEFNTLPNGVFMWELRGDDKIAVLYKLEEQ